MPKIRIFLCHSSSDKPSVRGLYQQLKGNDLFDPWLDEINIIPGLLWRPEIERAIKGSDVVLVCLSRTSITKTGFVNKELAFALDCADERPEGRIFLVPVRLDDCEVPDRLCRWQWVDLFSPDGYDRLLDSLRFACDSLDRYALNQPILRTFDYLEEPVEITATRKNHTTIDSRCLLWDQCTIALWVFVPIRGKGLRNSPHNRYILAHHTGRAATRQEAYCNQFCLRHTSADGGYWSFTVSDNTPNYTPSPIRIDDYIGSGWHHFILAWSRSLHKARLQVDCGAGGEESVDLPLWPDRDAGSITIGTWVTPWHGHYCETRLSRLLMCDQFLDPSDSSIRKHLSARPKE